MHRVRVPIATVAVLSVAFAFFLFHGVDANAGSSVQSSKERDRYFCGKGEVISLGEDGITVTIKHERIEGLMGAMTMSFKAEDQEVLKGISPGDHVRFTLKDTTTKTWLIFIEKIETGK